MQRQEIGTVVKLEIKKEFSHTLKYLRNTVRFEFYIQTFTEVKVQKYQLLKARA